MQRIQIIGLLSVLTLAGCNAAPVQPQQEQLPPAQTATQAEQAPAIEAQFEQLNSRITLLQEQFLELKIQNSAVAERVQLLLTQFQLLAQEVKRGQSIPETEPQPGLEEMMLRLDQQLVELQQLAPELGGGDPFKLVTCYTANGQWILIRYNRFSGESWISAENSWVPLEEDFTPTISSYEVQLVRATGDVKGYVAARIDQNTGDAWWLNRNRWVRYQQ